MTSKFLLQLSRPGTRQDVGVPSQVSVMMPIDRDQLTDASHLSRLAGRLLEALEHGPRLPQVNSREGETCDGSLATSAQVRAIYALTRRLGFETIDYVREHGGVHSPEKLSRREASQLIERLGGTTRKPYDDEPQAKKGSVVF